MPQQFSLETERRYWQMRIKAMHDVLGVIDRSITIQPGKSRDRGYMKGSIDQAKRIEERLDAWRGGNFDLEQEEFFWKSKVAKLAPTVLLDLDDVTEEIGYQHGTLTVMSEFVKRLISYRQGIPVHTPSR